MSFGEVDTLGMLFDKLQSLFDESQGYYESFLDTNNMYKKGQISDKEFFQKLGDYTVAYSALEFLAIKVIFELKKSQGNIMNFVQKYLGEDGLMNDATGYHKALSLAMNPSKFAQYFYEQGKAQAIESDARKTKNINMKLRSAPEVVQKGGTQIRTVNSCLLYTSPSPRD